LVLILRFRANENKIQNNTCFYKNIEIIEIFIIENYRFLLNLDIFKAFVQRVAYILKYKQQYNFILKEEFLKPLEKI